MDEANIERIEAQREESNEAIDQQIRSEVDAEFRDRDSVASRENSLESTIITRSKKIRTFMCAELGRRENIFIKLGAQALRVHSFLLNNDRDTHTLETDMFEIDDDIASFTRSGWVFHLNYHPSFREGFRQQINPDFSHSNLLVVRKTISLELGVDHSALTPWYQVTLSKPPADFPKNLASPPVLSLEGANDLEQEQAYHIHRNAKNKKFEAKFKELKESTGKEDWEIMVSRELYANVFEDDNESARPGSGIKALQHCYSILEAGITELKVR